MPLSFARPGAYINEQLLPLTSSANQIPGQATAAFVSYANIGPTVPVFCSSWQSFVALFGNFNVTNGNMLHFAVNTFFGNGGQGCFVMRVANTTNAVVATQALTGLNAATVTTATVSQAGLASKGVWGNNVFLEVIPLGPTGASSNDHINFNVYYVPGGGSTPASYGQFLVEQYLNVSTNPADSRYITNIVNAASQYIQLTQCTSPYVSGSSGTDLATLAPTACTSGSDGTTAPAAGTLGSAVTTFFDQYCQQQILNINMPMQTAGSGFVAPTAADINNVTAWAAGREDVFVLVDGPIPTLGETSAAVVTTYTTLMGTLTPTSFAALYAPYLLIQDPSSASPGATRLVPPSGSILGLYNTTDSLVGPQQVAAGVLYGQLSCLGLEVQFSLADLDNLWPLNINAIKKTPGAGFCVFGARTCFTGFPSMYVPVRRTLMKLEHDMVILTQFAIFQPNAPTLWANIQTVLQNYLTTQTLAGLLGTRNPVTAYSVTCDSTNNSPSTAAAGIVNITVSVAIGSPVELVIINISQLQSGAITTTSTTGTAVG